MNKLQSHIDKIGWQFDNTYSKLPENMFSKLGPIPVKAPKVVIFNNSLSNLSHTSKELLGTNSLENFKLSGFKTE